jgi:hypothetical protein
MSIREAVAVEHVVKVAAAACHVISRKPSSHSAEARPRNRPKEHSERIGHKLWTTLTITQKQNKNILAA